MRWFAVLCRFEVFLQFPWEKNNNILILAAKCKNNLNTVTALYPSRNFSRAIEVRNACLQTHDTLIALFVGGFALHFITVN